MLIPPTPTPSSARNFLPRFARLRPLPPPKPLSVYRKHAFSKKNADTSCGPSGKSPRIWWQCLSLPDEIAQRFANYANNCVANNIAKAARNLVVAKRGALVHKAGQTPDEVPGRPLGISYCNLRSFLPQMLLPFALPSRNRSTRQGMVASSSLLASSLCSPLLASRRDLPLGRTSSSSGARAPQYVSIGSFLSRPSASSWMTTAQLALPRS